jgi:gamma-tubulin complex component 2
VTSKQRSDVEDTAPQMGFTLRQTVDSSISSLSERILPVADRYVRVVDYADLGSRYEQGLVSHAFCAALKVLIKVLISLTGYNAY